MRGVGSTWIVTRSTASGDALPQPLVLGLRFFDPSTGFAATSGVSMADGRLTIVPSHAWVTRDGGLPL